MRKSLIVAFADNGVIGINNQLPWHISDDLKRFKSLTMNKPIIMGRKTFDSLPNSLPGRANIVITREANILAVGAKVVNSLAEAFMLAQDIAEAGNIDEAFVIGGAQIYTQALSLVDRLYITQIQANIEGDTYFPEYDKRLWQQVDREDHSAIAPNSYPFSFIVYDRITAEKQAPCV